jgi:hypothetical protein
MIPAVGLALTPETGGGGGMLACQRLLVFATVSWQTMLYTSVLTYLHLCHCR